VMLRRERQRVIDGIGVAGHTTAGLAVNSVIQLKSKYSERLLHARTKCFNRDH
jgi:hypothetical protein